MYGPGEVLPDRSRFCRRAPGCLMYLSRRRPCCQRLVGVSYGPAGPGPNRPLAAAARPANSNPLARQGLEMRVMALEGLPLRPGRQTARLGSDSEGP